ncbi:MAG: flagellar protein FlgN [Opitutaceae bacterium]|jgi:flagellar biosynthesis/type III secretory pathway chaperone
MTTFSNNDWEPLIEALRTELEEYGALFNHLTRQQEEIFARKVDTVLEINGDLDSQARVIAAARERRREVMDDLAKRDGLPAGTRLTRMLDRFPDYVRPLLEALVRDINLMINRTRRKARQNHILLARAVELTQETLRLLQPGSFTKTYARSGQVSVSGEKTSRYQAVG